MPEPYAREFDEIASVLRENQPLRAAVKAIALAAPLQGKALESRADRPSEERRDVYREILVQLIDGDTSLNEACAATAHRLPVTWSPHAANRRVFSQGWNERLVRTSFSAAYNQAVIEMLIAEGYAEGFVYHSSAEDPNSPCSRLLAGGQHPLRDLLDRLLPDQDGNYSREVHVPNHPHCTHTVSPPQR